MTHPTGAIGTAVGGQFLYDSCGHCDYCVRGEQILCSAKRITGVVADGGYAEYAILKAGFVTELPSGLDPVAAAPLMCAGITAFNGLRQGGATAGSRVAIVGAGGIGALVVSTPSALVPGSPWWAGPRAEPTGHHGQPVEHHGLDG
ncbi:alcohol dehydrogenase catalytic domain-containing protein [Streptomyces sp. NPDC056683]|uniref:alcohol dehydrogenase catalytic domain-containing protein n=1 Tax=Streptomyces sp. NPDC056683 TaxID=3345910 RepID=UPI00369A8069